MCVENKRGPYSHLMPWPTPVGGPYSADPADEFRRRGSMHSGSDSPDMTSNGERRHANRTTHRVWGVVASRQLTPLPIGTGGVVVGWRSTWDSRGYVRGLTRTRPPVIHRWCMGAIVGRRFVWELGDGTSHTRERQHTSSGFVHTDVAKPVSWGCKRVVGYSSQYPTVEDVASPLCM